MRIPRLKAPPDAPRGFYHCVSRVVDRRLVFGDSEKEHFCLLLGRYAHFCGLQILTFCVMGNHFHLLVEVPKRPDSPPGDETGARPHSPSCALGGEGVLVRVRTYGFPGV